MSRDPAALHLVSCRHCLRPISLVGEIDESELGSLRAHLRGCSVDPLTTSLDGENLLANFRVSGAFAPDRVEPRGRAT